MGRNDLQTIKNMGANLIRLYDWEPRNEHFDFLNTCQSLGIKVLAPASNYFLQPGGGFPMRDTLIPNLIRSFGNAPNNAGGTDYHPAIAGLTFGNEPFFHDFSVNECIEFTRSWVSIEQAQFPGFRRPLIGHPVDFGLRNGAQYPAWDFYTALLDGLAGTTTRDLQNRLFLSPNTTNDAEYLYTNAAGSGQGYVPLTFNQFQKPLLFTEISQDRTKPDYLGVVDGQLRRSIAYGAMNPTHLLGICFFQFADKVWLCPTGGMCPSEGSFGAHGHTNTVISAVKYVPGDFTHTDESTIPPFSCADNELNVDQLTRNPVYDTVASSYGISPAPLPPPRQ
jgi:hypothetical protein